MLKIIARSKKSLARVTQMSLPRGTVTGPFFMPIATRGAVKHLTTAEVEQLGAEIILSNTYHLLLRPGDAELNKLGGLHRFMNWKRPILTDSGGFQVFSLANHRKVSDSGVTFRDPQSGERHELTPERAIQIQQRIGSDIAMVLDECPPYPCSEKELSAAVARTSLWARRCLTTHQKKSGRPKQAKGQKLFGIVQGGIDRRLREQSAKDLASLPFDGFAIGGVAVGEPRTYLPKILSWTVPLLPESAPRYLMGVGRPEDIVAAVRGGIDMFDCVIPTREARHGRLYTWKTWKSNRPSFAGKNWYQALNITNAEFRSKKDPVDAYCDCSTCKTTSRAYLHHLFRINEPLGARLATVHNLAFYLRLMKEIQSAIRAGKF